MTADNVAGEFDVATAVSALGDGRYAAAVAPGWDIASNANGGYLIAIAARAMADVVGMPPLSVTAHYLSPGRVGPCEVGVEVVRAGRRTATASARLRSADRDVIVVLGTFGEQSPSGPSVVVGSPPDLPPVGECVSIRPPDPQGFGHRVDTRVRPGDAGFRDGVSTGRAEFAAWFQFADRQPIDAFGLLQAADALPPVVFNLLDISIGWAPTLELTVHVRGVPAPGPLRCRLTSRFVQGGMFEEDGEIWDSSGRLVCQSRQLALLPRREG